MSSSSAPSYFSIVYLRTERNLCIKYVHRGNWDIFKVFNDRDKAGTDHLEGGPLLCCVYTH